MCVVAIVFLDTLSPTTLVMELLRTLGDRTECAVECLYQTPVIETLLAPIITLLKGKQVSIKQVSIKQVSIKQVSIKQISIKQVSIKQVGIKQVSIKQVRVKQVSINGSA
jgi:hypothetical protein